MITVVERQKRVEGKVKREKPTKAVEVKTGTEKGKEMKVGIDDGDSFYQS